MTDNPFLPMPVANPRVPREDELYKAIAARLPDATPDDVRETLAAHGVSLTSPLPARRALCVHRLYFDGTKTGTTDNDGPFAIDIPMGPGPWVIASEINSAGKSTVLWALSWALRGDSVEEYRRPDPPDWITYIRADLDAGGVAVSVRLTFDKPDHPKAALLTADTIEQLDALTGREEQGPGVRKAADAEPGDVKALIDRLMLDRLGLRPFSVWTAEPGAPQDHDGNRDSREDIHAWATFFYAIALNAGRDKILLGPTSFGQLPAKLLQIFLDVPYATELTRLTTATKTEMQDMRRVERRAREDAAARDAHLVPLRAAHAQALARLKEIETTQPDLAALLTAVDTSAHETAAHQRAHRDAEQQLASARKARLKDQRAALRARRSDAARLLLGALDPETCPRCDHDIDDQRRATEDTQHRCAVCAHQLPEIDEDPQDRAEALRRIDDREQASRRAEALAAQTVTAAARALDTATSAHAHAQQRLADARSGDWFTRLETARREAYQLEGAIAVASGKHQALPAAVGTYLDTATTPTPDEAVADTDLLTAAASVLNDVVGRHTRALFADLNDKIVEIAQALGVTNLTSVNLGLNGNVNAKKSGKPARFASFGPGERLRMRIATVIGMIIVGRDHGIMSHPGLLLIDAPTAEEVVPGDARVVLQKLYDTANTVPGMQIVITSIENALWDIFPPERIVAGPENRQLF